MKKDNKNSRTEGIEFDAFVMVIASWPGELKDDIDLYIRDPNGNVVFFRNKNNKIMHLDRDDMGRGIAGIENNEGLFNNREVITIRQKLVGEFIVNAHVYSKRSSSITPVAIKIIKLRPYQVIFNSIVTLNSPNQEKTACRFTVNDAGKIEDINQLHMPIARDIIKRQR